FSGRDQLVAGGKHRDANAPLDIKLRQSERSRQRHILRPQPLTGPQRGMARRNVLARRADIGTGLQTRRQNHLAVFETDVFLHEYGIGAVGHRRAGENAHRLPRLDRRLRRGTGLNPPGHGKRLLLPLRQIPARHRVAIDGGICEWRQRQRRRDVACTSTPVGGSKRNRLELRHRGDPRRNEADSLIDRHHRTAEGKAIVGQLRHVASQPSAALFASTSSTGSAAFSIMAAIASISSRWAVGSVVSTDVSVAMPATPGSSGNRNGLPLAARETSILRCGSRLKPSMTTRSTRESFASNSGIRGSSAPRSSCIRAQRWVEDTRTSVAPDGRCRQESLPGISTSKARWACLITATRRASLSQRRITRVSKVVLPAPLHPARPITFIPFSAPSSRNRAGHSLQVLYI